MKIFQHIKSLTQRALSKLLDFVNPHRYKRSDKKMNDSQHRKIKKKRSKKRKICDNMRQSHSSKNFSRSVRSQRRFPFFGKLINRKVSSSLQEIKSQSELNMGQIATNELIAAASGVQIQDGHLFIDKNGLQISAIEFKGNKSDQLNNSDESDPQILKFILGDQVKLKQQQNPQEKQQRKIENKITKREWWLQALQSEGISQNCAPFEKNENEKVVYQKSKSLSIKSKPKTKKIKHGNKQILSSQHKKKFKVVQIIDLVQDQNRPKVFHVPLSKPLIL